MKNYQINKILQEKKITTFLAERGIHPVRESAGKKLYCCPIHAGDKDPSFIVYEAGTKGREYQTYHCFGCKSGISIINLKADIDHVSIKESVRFFLDGMDIEIKDIIDANIDSLLDELYKDKIDESVNDGRIEMTLLALNNICRIHLEECGDDEEVSFFDNRFYKKVDEIAMSGDADTLDEYYHMLIDNEVLAKRSEMILGKKEDEASSASKWII